MSAVLLLSQAVYFSTVYVEISWRLAANCCEAQDEHVGISDL